MEEACSKGHSAKNVTVAEPPALQELESTPEFLNECLESMGSPAWETELERNLTRQLGSVPWNPRQVVYTQSRDGVKRR